MSFLLNVIVSGIAVCIAAWLSGKGVEVDNLLTGIIVAIVLGLINATIGNILRLLTLPLNFLTLGLVGGIISFLMLLLTDTLVDGFQIQNIMSAIIFSILLGFISGILGAKK